MHSRAQAWYGRRTWHWRDWPAGALQEGKRQAGARISVVIPAHDEEGTIAGVVGSLRAAVVERIPLVDEVVVIDSDSADGTAAAAARAGATVHRARDVAPGLGAYPGKGEALWKSLLVTEGDLLVFIDADLTRWGPHFVTGLLGPLLAEPGVLLVKGFYARAAAGTDGSASTEGGRVTELVARPLLGLWWPELSGVVQPLAGEWAARRELMESLPIPVGYGVELATLLDTAARHGLDSVAQVDLGSRAHKHQTDHDLALMAAELLMVAERRRPQPRGPEPPDPRLTQFVREDGLRAQVRPVSRPIPVRERPPVAGLAGLAGLAGWPAGRPAAPARRPAAKVPRHEQPREAGGTGGAGRPL